MDKDYIFYFSIIEEQEKEVFEGGVLTGGRMHPNRLCAVQINSSPQILQDSFYNYLKHADMVTSLGLYLLQKGVGYYSYKICS